MSKYLDFLLISEGWLPIEYYEISNIPYRIMKIDFDQWEAIRILFSDVYPSRGESILEEKTSWYQPPTELEIENRRSIFEKKRARSVDWWIYEDWTILGMGRNHYR